ncbi:MAG: hypothetical protein D6824_07350, partial [Planctomycetota bacterium]
MRLVAKLARRFPDIPIAQLDEQGLERRDAALAHRLVETTIKRWLTLAWLLEGAAKRPLASLEPRVQAALLVGAAQLCFFDRVPARAAVDESVRWISHAGRSRAAGLVNAALRRVAEAMGQERREQATLARDELPLAQGGARTLAPSALLPRDPLDRLSVATGTPRPLLRRWVKQWSLAEAQRIALHSLRDPPTIVHTAYARHPLPGADLLTPHESPGFHLWKGSRQALAELLGQRHDVWAQDPAAAAALDLATELSPRLVADLCAGRGTKTKQLLAMFPDATVLAYDDNPKRRRELAQVFQGHSRVVLVEDRQRLLDWAGKVELVVVDAPCSNTAVLARRPEARHRA